jgi:O-antigen/teichoic acid export membrane protein
LEALRLLAFVSIPALWGLSAVAHEFVDVVLGPSWHGAILPLALVSLMAPARMVMAVFGTAVSAIGRADIELRNMLVSSLILPVAFIVGVRWGVNGLAASWVIAMPLILAANLRRTCNALGMSVRAMLLATRTPLAAGVVMMGAVSLARLGLAEMHEAARLPLLIIVGMGSYLTLVQLLERSIWTDARRLLTALRN